MKQLVQYLDNGETILEDVPAPVLKPGHIIVKTIKSLVSIGTESMLIDFGKANIIGKIKQQPERVKMVLDKIKSDGLLPTIEAIRSKLDIPIPMGYCNVGHVIEIAEDVKDFKIGDRILSNGPHAEFVCVPVNLSAKVPENVSDEQGTFGVIGAIALHGIRLAEPTFGEIFVVIGLGLIGMITVQLLKANGCRVIGFDINSAKVELARSNGIDAIKVDDSTDMEKIVEGYSNGIGADGVIITASSKKDDIISKSAKISRKRGRIILIGVIDLKISRSEFYEKELSFQVACSYGPGRYDNSYEINGLDYPLPYVRWTEKRNFEIVLNAISSKRIEVDFLITERVSLNQYKTIYNSLGKTGSLASIIQYDEFSNKDRKFILNPYSFNPSKPIIGIIGAGNFTNGIILPHLKKLDAQIKYIASANGLSGKVTAKKFKIPNAITDYLEILNDPEIDIVLISTRHNLHAKMVIDALNAGKHVFVEKPLALTRDDIQSILNAQQSSKKTLTVGYNRRFSSHIKKIKNLIPIGTMMNIIVTINAGYLSKASWVNDSKIGGGRIIGEACHFFDLLIFLNGSLISSVCMNSFNNEGNRNVENGSILVKFTNGSNGVINYFSNGHREYSKERIELYFLGKTLILDNFRTTKGYGFKSFSKFSTMQDKGHRAEFKSLLDVATQGGNEIIPLKEILNSSLATIASLESLELGSWREV